MIFENINKMEELQSVLNKGEKKEPFMKLGEGKAPNLNYNLPQSSCFSTYSNMRVAVASVDFKKECFAVPQNNYFEQIESKTAISDISVLKSITMSIQLQNIKSKIDNYYVSQPNINLPKANNIETPATKSTAETKFERTQNEDNSKLMYANNIVFNDAQLLTIAKKKLQPIITEKFGGYGVSVNTVKSLKRWYREYM